MTVKTSYLCAGQLHSRVSQSQMFPVPRLGKPDLKAAESLKQGNDVICAKKGEWIAGSEDGEGETGKRNWTCPGDKGLGHCPQSCREGTYFRILFIKVSHGQTCLGDAVYYIKMRNQA